MVTICWKLTADAVVVEPFVVVVGAVEDAVIVVVVVVVVVVVLGGDVDFLLVSAGMTSSMESGCLRYSLMVWMASSTFSDGGGNVSLLGSKFM